MTHSFIRTRVLDGDILVLRLYGTLDVTSSNDFKEPVRTHLDEGKWRFIVDCANLGYVSSAGIGSLIFLRSKIRRFGGVVKFAAIQGPVADVLKLMKVNCILDIHGDTEFARQSFG